MGTFTREDGFTVDKFVHETRAAWRAGFMRAEDRAELLNNSLAPKVGSGEDIQWGSRSYVADLTANPRAEEYAKKPAYLVLPDQTMSSRIDL